MDEPLSTFSIDVDNASYSNIRRLILQNNTKDMPDGSVRIEEMVNYFDYKYPQPKGQHPFSVSSQLSDCPWNADRKLLCIGLQALSDVENLLRQNNFVFLIDVSGSMSSDNKLPLVKSALKKMINNLNPQDKVAIVVYAGAAGLVLPSTPIAEKEKILEALNRLQSGGSTAGGAGIELAYKVAKENYLEKGNNRIVLCTDGDFNVGTSNTGDLSKFIESKRDEGSALTVCGFGMGNYREELLEELGKVGNGNFFYIDTEKEAERVFVKKMNATMNIIAKDVKLQLEFNPAQVKSYRLVGYENRLLSKEDFNDDTKDAGELGPGHCVTALYEIELTNANTPASELSSTDPLKYQTNFNTNASKLPELLTLKLRYKKTEGKKSNLFEYVVPTDYRDKSLQSSDFRFAASVAAFGMLLRKSKYTQALKKEDLIMSIETSTDGNEDREEFLALVKKYYGEIK